MDRLVHEVAQEDGMAYVITKPCQGICDTECTAVCPCDCIVGPVAVDEVQAVPKAERAGRFGSMQLFINPDECIDCGACLPVCPVEAIYQEDDLPAEWSEYAKLNEQFFD